MTDIELVIKIPEILYAQIQSDAEIMIYGGMRSWRGVLTTLLRSVRNGTPLPKGHGALKDVDDLDITTITTDDYSGNEVLDIALKEDVDNAPTIIEADKADKKPTCGDCQEWGTVNCPETYREPTKNDDICDSFKAESGGYSKMNKNQQEEIQGGT